MILAGELYDSAVTVPFWIEQGVSLGVLNDTVLTTTLCRLFGDPQRGLELYESRREWCDHPSNHAYFRYVQMQVNRVLCLLAIAEDLDEEARVARMAEVDEFRARLAGWVGLNDANLSHTLALVDAERARVDGRDLDAQAAYDESIRLARLNGFQQHAADAAERAAHFYKARGRQVVARAYAEEAIDGWLAWGATGLAEHVRHAFDDELSTAPTRADATSVDVQAVLRASEALTGQVDLERLLFSLVETVRRVAGADRVVLALALDDDGVLRVESVGGVDDDTQVLQHEPIEESASVPPEILRYTFRTGETVILHDAARRGRFTTAPYIRETRPRSVLCTPLEHQGRRIGVVYLENHLVTHAFTSDRVRLLSALAGQASIAVQNAKLVGDLQTRGDELAAKNEQLTELDQLREEFLAKTSHELRTPLHGIIGLAQSMLDAGDLDEVQLHNLELVASSGRRLNNLINDILDLSTAKKRELDLRLGPTSLREVVEDVVAMARTMVGTKPVEVRNDVPAGEMAVIADRDRLEQILLNLVGNGVKFTEAGSVSVTVQPDGDGRVRIAVTDTGPGIPVEHQTRIFQAFEQGSSDIVQRHGGTGLGLSVASELVGLHGSTLTIDSREGAGASFSFTLPAADVPADELTTGTLRRIAPVRPELLTVDTRLPAGDGSHVLIVDDEPVNLQILFNYLGRLGYRVTAATNGTDALRMCADGLRPDVVLLDVMMPGVDGLEVCRRLRETTPANDLPIIMLTARTQIDDLVAGLEAGANDYVTKPFSSKEVSARLSTQLKLSGLHHAVGRFVPRMFLEMLGRESVAQVKLGDAVQRDMTVMFSDIRAFTQISRNMTPAENFAFINAYLGVMEPAITSSGGFVDKYVGDGIMALFTRPSDALQAGLQMQAALAEFNADRARARKIPIRMGIGLHAGSLMLGTVGGVGRMDTTVISDVVNLASRMETLTKAYGSGLLVTRATLEGADEGLAVRHVDRVALRPGEPPMDVFEVYEGEPEQVRISRDATRETFEQAIALFHERAFDEAEQLFDLVSAMDSADQAARTYQDRCRAIRKQFTTM
jgi:signal transduction histidine kinase/class 3 adenylate cyclase